MSKQFDANGTDIDAYPDRAFQGGVYDGGIMGGYKCPPRIGRDLMIEGLIERAIKTHSSISEAQLSLFVMSQIGPAKFETEAFLEAIESVLRQGKMKKLSFSTGNRHFAIYFPPDTRFVINQ